MQVLAREPLSFRSDLALTAELVSFDAGLLGHRFTWKRGRNRQYFRLPEIALYFANYTILLPGEN